MASKKICIFLLFFVLISYLKAQNTIPSSQQVMTDDDDDEKLLKKNYVIEKEGKKTIFYQNLSWEKHDGILYYEFELEKKDTNGKWNRIDTKKIKDNFVNLSLTHGNYRYRVRGINLLGQQEAASKYRSFDIFLAYQPKTTSITPKAVYFDEKYSNTVIVHGSYFRETTTFALKKGNGKPIYGKLIELTPDGKKATVQFNILKINPGNYTFVVTDPSGLEDTKRSISFKFQKPIDFHISAGYSFSAFVGDTIFKEYLHKNLITNGGIFRVTVIPIKRPYGTFGINLTTSGTYLQGNNKNYTLSTSIVATNLNLAYSLPIIRKRLNFDLHLGGGAVFLVGTQFKFSKEVKSPIFNYWTLSINAGAALQVYVYKQLYLELNVDNIFPFKKGLPKYIIQPSLSIGWEF